MKTFEAIKRGAAVLKDVLPPMVIIGIFNFVSACTMMMIIGLNPTQEKIAEVTGPMAIILLFIMLAWIFIEGGLFSSVMSVLKTGDLNMDEFLGNCSKYFLRLLGINVIGAVITILVWLIGAFLTGVFVAFGGGNNIFFNILGGIVLLLTVIGVLIIAIPLLISQYFTVIKNIGIRDSLFQAFDFLKKYFWKLVIFFIVLVVCILIVSFAVNLIAAFLGNATKGVGALMISIILTSVVNAVVGVFSTLCIMTYLLGILQEEQPISAE